MSDCAVLEVVEVLLIESDTNSAKIFERCVALGHPCLWPQVSHAATIDAVTEILIKRGSKFDAIILGYLQTDPSTIKAFLLWLQAECPDAVYLLASITPEVDTFLLQTLSGKVQLLNDHPGIPTYGVGVCDQLHKALQS